MDIYILLLSHGNLAKEMYQTAELILGNIENAGYVTLPSGTDLTNYKNEIISKVKEHDKVLILTDLFGGSPFMITSQVFGQKETAEKMEIVTGMNLPMVLEVVSQIQNGNTENIEDVAKIAGQNGIINLRNKLGELGG